MAICIFTGALVTNPIAFSNSMDTNSAKLKTEKTSPTKILFVSKWGETLDLAYAAHKEGNKVKFFIADKSANEIGYSYNFV